MWLQHLPDRDSQVKFEEAVRYGINTPFGQRLIAIIEEFRQALDRQETTQEDYSSPSWSHKQAHRNGQRQAYDDVLNLLQGLRK